MDGDYLCWFDYEDFRNDFQVLQDSYKLPLSPRL